MYWVDDPNSKYYNKLVEITSKNFYKKSDLYFIINKKDMDWQTAEHLCSFPHRYSYAIEIKYNAKCIKEKGSAIFIHSSIEETTSGCVAISEMDLYKILTKIKKGTKIKIICSIS